MRDIRKHIAWYLHGFPAGPDLRRALALVTTRAELDRLLDQLDRDIDFPPRDTARAPGSSGLGRPCPKAGWTTLTTVRCRSAPT